MPKKYPGLYLYFDWLRGLDKVPSAVAMEIIRNLWHYAEERRPPRPLSKPQYEVIQMFLMEQLKRSIRRAEINKQNALMRCAIAEEQPKKSFADMNDEELLEIFRTDEIYKDDDPEELLALQRILRKGKGETNQTNA